MTDQFPGATKMVLSPAAQAVLDAYGRQTGDIDCLWHPSELKGLAAVLRTAADYLIERSPWPGHIESTGVNWSSNQLFMIADELENQ
jgi:hypothetical protein